MKILVTGASGFVGSHLCEKLESLGHEVYALLRDGTKFRELGLKAKIITADLSGPTYQSFLSDIPKDLDAVIHTAGLVHSFNSQDFYRINYEATIRLFHGLKKMRPTGKKSFKFIFISSLAAMGPSLKDKIATEKKWPKPISEYGKSKLLAETQLQELEVQFPEVELFIFRPPMIIGPRDPAIIDILKMVRDGIVLTGGPGGFQKQYSFISIYDLVDSIVAITLKPLKGPKLYLPAHPSIVTLEQIVEETRQILGRKPVKMWQVHPKLLLLTATLLEKMHKLSPLQLRLTPDKLKEILAEAWICSGEKLQLESGVKCQYDLKQILEITIKDYQDRGWL